MIDHAPCPVVPSHWPPSARCVLAAGHDDLRGGEAHLPSIHLASPYPVKYPIPTQGDTSMSTTITENHKTDATGQPLGGITTGPGIEVVWNDGQLWRDGERRPQYGAFVIDLLKASEGRLKFLQTTPVACEQNDEAMMMINKTINLLESRPADKGDVGVDVHGR